MCIRDRSVGVRLILLVRVLLGLLLRRCSGIQQAGVVLCMLPKIFSQNRVAGRARIARKGQVAVQYLLWRTPDAPARAVRIHLLVADVLLATTRVAASAGPARGHSLSHRIFVVLEYEISLTNGQRYVVETEPMKKPLSNYDAGLN
mgnify:CR=1 FL=1